MTAWQPEFSYAKSLSSTSCFSKHKYHLQKAFDRLPAFHTSPAGLKLTAHIPAAYNYIQFLFL